MYLSLYTKYAVYLLKYEKIQHNFIPFLFLFNFFNLSLVAQDKSKIDPRIIMQKQKKEQVAEKTGYGSYEVDSLHKTLEGLLPRLKYKLEKDKNGELRFVLPIASGETIKGISVRYIYNGIAYLYIDSETKKLKKIMFDFVRINPIGNKFKEEKRQLINPTPFFNQNKSEIDSNEDIILTYFEKEAIETLKTQVDYNKLKFEKKSEYVLKDIPYFEKKIRVVSTYANFVRRTIRKIKRELKKEEFSERIKIEYMLELY